MRAVLANPEPLYDGRSDAEWPGHKRKTASETGPRELERRTWRRLC
ncbi:hypothetical protein [Acetobacter sp. DsW_059]|nr:hypothetical protein [Acetobacter sp. DsW_059]